MSSPDPSAAQVLDHGHGGLLVTGPPGSGKTRLLLERFARLIESGVRPERVALFALHRRAARDARDYLLGRLERSVPQLPVFTAHGFAFRVMGRRFGDLGYPEPPQVLAAPDQYAVVRGMLRAERPEDWPRLGHLLGVRTFAQQVADLVLRAQERLLTPDDLDGLAKGSGREEYLGVSGFYRRYLDQQRLRGRVDFGGLLMQTVELLRRDLSDEEAFIHLMVDDYQDATPATEAILASLSPAAETVVAAADPHGHVFSYRGGTLEPLERIGPVLGCRDTVHLDAPGRVEAGSLRPLEDPSAGPGIPPAAMEARVFAHPGEEAEAVADELVRLRVQEGVPWERMAVILRRYGPYLLTLRHALGRHGVPFLVVAEEAAVAAEAVNRPIIGLFRYVEREVVRDDLLETLLTSPIGGMDPHDVRRLRREARAHDVGLRALVETADLAGLSGDLRERTERFRAVVRELPERAARDGPDGAFFWLWSTLPAFAGLVEYGSRPRDLDALAAFGDVLSRFVERRPGASLGDYLDTLDAAEFGPDPWIPPEERAPHAVRVVSAHRSHGMNFDAAMVVGCLEGEFPSLGHAEPVVDLDRLVAPATPAERVRARLAEERALFRLAISRAPRTILFASHSTSARNPRTPSRFAERLGLSWNGTPPGAAPAASEHALEAAVRRQLADPQAPPPERLAALASLSEIGARPDDWWWGREWTDPGIPLHGDVIRTSYSKLSILDNCPLQYLYAAELGLDPERTHQMWVGTVVHGIIDRVQQGDLERSEEAVLAALEDAWREDVFPNQALERQRLRDARDMLRRWIRDKDTKDLELVASERSFEFPLDGAVIRGRIDSIYRQGDGRLRIVDYKTGRQAPSMEQLKEDLQMAAYFLAMRRVPELRELGDPGVLELAFLALDQRGGFKHSPFRPQGDYETRAQAAILRLVEATRSEEFAPSPEADCHFCDFKPICPVWPQGAEVTT